ncbi:MAG TPA: hypothetical protein VNZ43_04130 [Sphingomonadaceae bacterium]|nr:hypothetical protein [Sphingomonadaceae bacterium]
MRIILSRLTTCTAIAGLALLVSACGHSEKAESVDTNIESNVADDALDNGTVSDITATDATAGAEANMTLTNDSAAGNAVDTSSNAADAAD